MARTLSRGSYRHLTSLPAFGLYRDDELVATIRANDALAAARLFTKWEAKMPELRRGNHVKRMKP